MGTKRIQFFGILALLMASLCFGEAGDMTLTNNLCLKPGKKIKLFYDTQDYQYVDIQSLWLSRPALKIPCLAYGSGNFLTADSEGVLVFISTAPYYGDITSVWTDDNGDVSALTAGAGDTLNAANADSTIPWEVRTVAAPTTEGRAIWNSDEDSLKIGDGASTLTFAISGQAFHDSFSDFVSQEHIDWTGATDDFLTTGTLGAGVITGTAFVTDSNIGVSADLDLLQLASGALTVNGSATLNSLYIEDTDSDFTGRIEFVGTEMTEDRDLNIDLKDGTRTLTMQGSILVEDNSWINQDVTSDSATAQFASLAVTGALTGLTYNGLTQTISTPGIWYISDGTSQLLVSAGCDIDQNLSSSSAPGFATGVTIGNLTLADGSITDSGGTIDFDDENVVIGGTLTLNFSQPFLFTNRAGATLAIQGQTSGQTTEMELYTADADGTDDVCINLFAAGSPSDMNDQEQLKVGFDQSESYWQIYSGNAGEGTLYPVNIFTKGNSNQLVLGTDGDNSMSGNLSVTGTVSGATGSTFGNLTLADGSITDSGGSISTNKIIVSSSQDGSAIGFDLDLTNTFDGAAPIFTFSRGLDFSSKWLPDDGATGNKTCSNLDGCYGQAFLDTTNVTNAHNYTATIASGVRAFVAATKGGSHTGDATITTGAALYVDNGSTGGGATITSQYGLYVNSLTAGTSNYAIYTNDGPSHLGDDVDVTGIVSTTEDDDTLGVGETTFAVTSNVMTITGDGGGNTIATITGASSGTLLTMIFVDGNVTITDNDAHAANSVDLSAAFTSADDTTLQLVYDGTSWYETSRSAN